VLPGLFKIGDVGASCDSLDQLPKSSNGVFFTQLADGKLLQLYTSKITKPGSDDIPYLDQSDILRYARTINLGSDSGTDDQLRVISQAKQLLESDSIELMKTRIRAADPTTIDLCEVIFSGLESPVEDDHTKNIRQYILNMLSENKQS